ncbi:ribosome-recycling factor [Desulfovibrionales bacterium]
MYDSLVLRLNNSVQGVSDLMKAQIDDAKTRMEKALQGLAKDFARLRTGRASSSLVEDIKVEYYGNVTLLSQIASVVVLDSRTITVQPWDRNSFNDIEKAIRKSDLGLNPINDGKLIRIVIPPLTEERRKDLIKVAHKYTEEAKVTIRNVRRDSNEVLKKMQKDKKISEDELHKSQDDMQKLTNSFVSKADQVLQAKDKEIMEI